GDDQVFVGRVDRSAAHAHRVDHRHAAGGDVVAVTDPATGLPADPLVEVGARLPDQVEQPLGGFVDRLRRSRNAAVDVCDHFVIDLQIAQQVTEFGRELSCCVLGLRTDVETQD